MEALASAGVYQRLRERSRVLAPRLKAGPSNLPPMPQPSGWGGELPAQLAGAPPDTSSVLPSPIPPGDAPPPRRCHARRTRVARRRVRLAGRGRPRRSLAASSAEGGPEAERGRRGGGAAP